VVTRQFLALEGSGVTHVASPVDGQPELEINYHALVPFFRSPVEEWNDAVEKKKVKEFEEDLFNLSRKPHLVIERVFVTNKQQALDLATAISPTAMLLRSAVWDAAINLSKIAFASSVFGGPSGFLVAALLERWGEEKAIERKDAVRELILFASEVERTNLLIRAWNVLDQTVRAGRGTGFLVLEDLDGQPVIAALTSAGDFTSVDRAGLTSRLLPAVARASKDDALILPSSTES
jgi:hypothetical protein